MTAGRGDRPPAPLITSPARRLLRLGGLVGRVGSSVVAERALDLLLRPGPARDERQLENLVANALRIVETLGEMKGAAMKIGQMLSLQEGLLPPEVAEVLRLLQREAPRVPPEVMRYEIEGSLGAPIAELFSDFDEEAFAAASIGQVHAARLADGREVAVKVQYPLIREVVTADLKNMKALFKRLFALVFKADFDPLWEEIRDRLLEELDYRHEAESLRRLAGLHADVPEVLIPGVIAERSTDRVLTMERVDGISPTEAVSGRYPQELRNRWGRVLFEFQLRGLFEHRLLHTDPNLANFAFREDGRVVVYDFGNVKEVPDALARGYAGLFSAALHGRREELPDWLAGIGLTRADGSPLPLAPLEPGLALFEEIFRRDPPYTFGEDPELYDKVMQLSMANWSQVSDMRFPPEVIWVNRSLGGHFGNLIRLRATGPWPEIAAAYVASA